MGSGENLHDSDSPFLKFLRVLVEGMEKPVVWFRETIVEPNRKEYYWYHERIQRVPTVDQCYRDDTVCIHEANQQYFLDKRVDQNIIKILRKRYEYCALQNENDQEVCNDMFTEWDNAVTNFFIKYGDLGIKDCALSCYMKQKHRLAWERRHGPVGTGKKGEREDIPLKEKPPKC